MYFLNISVDTADLQPSYAPEDLSINDQESIVEIMVEQILGFEDAIPEYDDNDQNNITKKNLSCKFLSIASIERKDNWNIHLLDNRLLLFSYGRVTKGYFSITSPPPIA